MRSHSALTELPQAPHPFQRDPDCEGSRQGGFHFTNQETGAGWSDASSWSGRAVIQTRVSDYRRHEHSLLPTADDKVSNPLHLPASQSQIPTY